MNRNTQIIYSFLEDVLRKRGADVVNNPTQLHNLFADHLGETYQDYRKEINGILTVAKLKLHHKLALASGKSCIEVVLEKKRAYTALINEGFNSDVANEAIDCWTELITKYLGAFSGSEDERLAGDIEWAPPSRPITKPAEIDRLPTTQSSILPPTNLLITATVIGGVWGNKLTWKPSATADVAYVVRKSYKGPIQSLFDGEHLDWVVDSCEFFDAIKEIGLTPYYAVYAYKNGKIETSGAPGRGKGGEGEGIMRAEAVRYLSATRSTPEKVEIYFDPPTEAFEIVVIRTYDKPAGSDLAKGDFRDAFKVKGGETGLIYDRVPIEPKRKVFYTAFTIFKERGNQGKRIPGPGISYQLPNF